MVYRFGDFLLDSATRQLLHNGTDIHLSSKGFDLLDVLLANRARAISKAELLQRLWPDTFVEEANLAGLVAEIRRALRDPVSNPVFVRTVYAFGYRFIGEVTVGESDIRSTLERARLYLVSDHGEMMLMDGANVIGRAPDATIQIDSPGVSRHHARIVVVDGQATLEDVESKNGTYLNGERIASSAPLADGSRIQLGRIVLTFRTVTATSPTATVPADTA